MQVDLKTLKPKFKYVRNIIYGHIIYKPIEKAKFVVPEVNTLAEYVSILAKEGIYQERNDHPIAVEVYVEFTTKKVLSDEQIEALKNAIIVAVMSRYPLSYELLTEMFVWGYDYSYTNEKKRLEAVLRVSRDGVNFQEFDISEDLIEAFNIYGGS